MMESDAVYGVRCVGKPRIFGKTMYTTDKMSSTVRRIDITDIAAPILTDEYRFASYIGNAASDGKNVYIAAGQQGYAKRKI